MFTNESEAYAESKAYDSASIVPIHTRSELSSDSGSAYDSASVASVASVNHPSSTFQDLDIDVSLSPLFINWCYNHGIKKLPITGEHGGIISARWTFFLLWNFDKQNEMQLLAKFKQILYLGFRASLNFRKFKVALNPMCTIALNVSLNLFIYYSFRHVLKPGTPEHHNTLEYPG